MEPVNVALTDYSSLRFFKPDMVVSSSRILNHPMISVITIIDVIILNHFLFVINFFAIVIFILLSNLS